MHTILRAKRASNKANSFHTESVALVLAVHMHVELLYLSVKFAFADRRGGSFFRV